MAKTEVDGILFGPAGNSNSFYEAGFKHTHQMPPWLSAMGLNAFEYSFGRGVNISSETAQSIGNEAAAYNIKMSAHAPYYINFASEKPESVENSFMYILRSLNVLKSFGGNRLVFHSGSASKTDRGLALSRTKDNLTKLAAQVKEAGYGDMILCPETMGKFSQIGNAEEIADLAAADAIYIPCVDFGHINCISQGGLKTEDDYKRIIDIFFDRLGEERAKKLHIHFSKIQYGNAGEIRHLNFSDTEYGPEFEPLLEVIARYKMSPVIICESAGNMAEDALAMKKYFDQIK